MKHYLVAIFADNETHASVILRNLRQNEDVSHVFLYKNWDQKLFGNLQFLTLLLDFRNFPELISGVLPTTLLPEKFYPYAFFLSPKEIVIFQATKADFYLQSLRRARKTKKYLLLISVEIKDDSDVLPILHAISVEP